MNRRFLPLFAFGALILAAFAVGADDPKPDEGDPPPVRLKKKNRPAVPPDQAKDEKAKDDKPKDEKAKDADKAKDDAPKDVEVGPGAKEDEQEVLDRVSRNMKTLEDRFVNKELDEGTSQLKDDIIKDIDSLIKMAQNPPPPSSGGGGSGDSGSPKSRGGNAGNSGGANEQPEPQPMDKTGMNPMKGGEGSKQGEGTSGAGVTNDNNPPKPPNGEDERGKWGHLPESLRASMSAFSSREDYMQKHQELIKEYYRNLARQGGKK